MTRVGERNARRRLMSADESLTDSLRVATRKKHGKADYRHKLRKAVNKRRSSARIAKIVREIELVHPAILSEPEFEHLMAFNGRCSTPVDLAVPDYVHLLPGGSPQ